MLPMPISFFPVLPVAWVSHAHFAGLSGDSFREAVVETDLCDAKVWQLWSATETKNCPLGTDPRLVSSCGTVPPGAGASSTAFDGPRFGQAIRMQAPDALLHGVGKGFLSYMDHVFNIAIHAQQLTLGKLAVAVTDVHEIGSARDLLARRRNVGGSAVPAARRMAFSPEHLSSVSIHDFHPLPPNPTDQSGIDTGTLGSDALLFADMRVVTRRGKRPVGDLRAGEQIWTLQNGFQPLRRIFAGHHRTEQDTAIRVPAHALAEGCPASDVLVDPDQPVMVRSDAALELLGREGVLVRARSLTDLKGIETVPVSDARPVFQVLLDKPQLIYVDGMILSLGALGSDRFRSVSSQIEEALFGGETGIAGSPESHDFSPTAKATSGRIRQPRNMETEATKHNKLTNQATPEHIEPKKWTH